MFARGWPVVFSLFRPPCRGWRDLEVPEGWMQVIRGPRPGQKAVQKVLMGEITRARQCLTGALLTLSTSWEAQEVVRELPEHVRAFAPDTPLAVMVARTST